MPPWPTRSDDDPPDLREDDPDEGEDLPRESIFILLWEERVRRAAAAAVVEVDDAAAAVAVPHGPEGEGRQAMDGWKGWDEVILELPDGKLRREMCYDDLQILEPRVVHAF